MKLVENILEFNAPDYRNPVKALRNLADQIEAGKFGEVGSCGVVIFGDTLEIFGSGAENDRQTISLLFAAAINRFAIQIEQQGR